jgi:hypothetical protein
VSGDFDGETRAVLTPVDIGADAGNFNGIDLLAQGSPSPLSGTRHSRPTAS